MPEEPSKQSIGKRTPFNQLKTTAGLLNPRKFSRNQALFAILVVVAIGGFFIYRSFAATPPANGSYTWGTAAGWNASSLSEGPYSPTFTNTAVIPGNTGNVCTSCDGVGLATATPNTTNLALNRPITATASTSTTQNLPAAAVDGNAATYWQTAVLPTSSDTASITIDLGSIVQLRTVVINMGTNYATSYNVGVGNDPTASIKANQTVGASGGIQTITFKSNVNFGRYVRIILSAPANQSAGIQVNDIAVYGPPTYQTTGTYSTVYNATSKVQWTGLTPSVTLNGGTVSSNTCTADTAAAAVSGPWTSCTTDPNSVGTALVASQYLKITFTFSTTDPTHTPDLTGLSLFWYTATPMAAPTISLATPTNGATVNGTVNLTSNPSTNVGMGYVEYSTGSTVIGDAYVAPYTVAWDTTKVPDGSYTITAQAFDSNGSATTSSPVTVTVKNTIASTWWKPTSSSSISWNWIIGNVPTSTPVPPAVYDIDGFDNTAATVTAIHNAGGKAICYIDVGTYEPGRSDDNLIPTADQGAGVDGWPGELWLNIADVKGLTPVVQDRMNMCKTKGFDAIEPDNIDGYTNTTGFPLTAAQQITYNTFLATTAHNLGLSIGLKNDVDQTSQLVSVFDWALDEECNKYTECSSMTPFTSANKAVFNAEYTDDGETTAKFCAADIAAHINGVLYDLDLDGKTYQPCGGWGTAPAVAQSNQVVKTQTVQKPSKAR